jgi:hypothetical protein
VTPNRRLAHSYADELPPPRPTIEPIITSWWEAFIILGQVVAVGAIMAVILFALFLWAGAVVEAP